MAKVLSREFNFDSVLYHKPPGLWSFCAELWLQLEIKINTGCEEPIILSFSSSN